MRSIEAEAKVEVEAKVGIAKRPQRSGGRLVSPWADAKAKAEVQAKVVVEAEVEFEVEAKVEVEAEVEEGSGVAKNWIRSPGSRSFPIPRGIQCTGNNSDISIEMTVYTINVML